MRQHFTDTVHCTSKAHCNRCRNSAKWRLMIAKTFDVPGNVLDFECPHGQGPVTDPTGIKLPVRGLGDAIAKATKAIGIKPCKGCEKRRKKLNKFWSK